VDWQFPILEGSYGVNSANPLACTADDTPEVNYIGGEGGVLKILQASPTKYDVERIYFQGFSQGAMMTTWAANCFASQIRGASQAGSGLKVGGVAITEEWCANSPNSKCEVGSTDGNNIPGGACPTSTSCEFFPIQPALQNNVVGEPLNWCLFAGCRDYLLGSIYSQDQFLTSANIPHTLVHYDGPHESPTNWMPKVAQCHGWPNAPTVESDADMWKATCDGLEQDTNEGKYCYGAPPCCGDGSSGSGGGGGGGSGGGSTCPSYCTEKLELAQACNNPNCDNELCGLEGCPDDGGESPAPAAPAPATATEDRCESFCGPNPNPNKCEWAACKGCDETICP